MYYAQLTIEFDRVYDAGLDNYCMRSTIKPASTTPEDLKTALLVRPGSTTVSEYVDRVATRTELSTWTTDLPVLVTLFSSPSLAAITVVPGDKIVVAAPVPPLWAIMYGITVGDEFVITGVAGTELTVATGLPDFAYPVSFQIWDSTGSTRKLPVGADPNPEDGIANRDYGGVPLTYYRASTHTDTFGSDMDAAISRLESLRTLAQGVVNEYNRDDYSGTSTEVFE